MSGEVSSFQEFFEVIRQPYRIELDDASAELLDAAWMDITVNVTIAVQEVKSEDH